MKLFTLLNMLFPNLLPILGDITLNPDFNANTLLKAIVHLISIGVILTCCIYGGTIIAQSSADESPAQKRKGIETIVMGLLLGGALETLMAMVIA